MKRYITILISAVVMVSTAVAREMTSENKLRYANSIIERFYVDSVDTQHVAEEAIIAMLKTLDPHSQYSNVEETRELTEPLQGNFSGIGIQFNMMNDTLYVIQTVAGGPSERVGVQAGDRILEANDTIIAGVKMKNNDIMKRLRGPRGTICRVKVLRKGSPEPIEFRITRDNIPIYSVDAAYIAEPGVGYIKVARFAETTADEVRQAVKKLQKQGMKHLVLDLEMNGGGYLNAAVEMAEMFLNRHDLIVYTKGDKVPYSEYRSESKPLLPSDARVVVMADQYSASASEILSGAIQDHDRGLIVGRRTFGKGLVQRPFPFPDGSMIRLTVARYYTPSGRCIQKPYADGEDAYELDLVNRYKSGELTNADSTKVDASQTFQTLRRGRTVYGGGGISPDVFVPLDTTNVTPYSRDVIARGVLNTFCIKYVEAHRSELKSVYKSDRDYVDRFEVTPDIMQQFVAAATKEGVEYNEANFKESESLLKSYIKAIIGRDLFEQGTYYMVMNPENNVYQEALRVITNEKEYNRLLGK